MTLPDELVEAVRLALLGLRKERIKAIVDDPDRAFSDHEQITESCEADADTAITAFLKWCEHEGVKLMVQEPTKEMVKAYGHHVHGGYPLHGENIGRVMWGKAPPHPWVDATKSAGGGL